VEVVEVLAKEHRSWTVKSLQDDSTSYISRLTLGKGDENAKQGLKCCFERADSGTIARVVRDESIRRELPNLFSRKRNKRAYRLTTWSSRKVGRTLNPCIETTDGRVGKVDEWACAIERGRENLNRKRMNDEYR
jgi:hypothetical protein